MTTLQMFFKVGKHMFILMLVALLGNIPAGKDIKKKDTRTRYKTYSKINIRPQEIGLNPFWCLFINHEDF